MAEPLLPQVILCNLSFFLILLPCTFQFTGCLNNFLVENEIRAGIQYHGIIVMYDISWFQKCDFYSIPIMSRFSTKSCVIPALLVVNLEVIGIW